ncbi:MAG: efflux RND transporter periplasmic adaptor subunit [Pseudomonadota bacterium]|nr:efflux RND transporter periplasmic adaptor subunit [Pseudomonadota bacterium]MEC9391997.1 efflux RND transporter periplasmic adaptor subunit [Pseudomonadota bacterium]MEC9459087.1 efflux RND transporter periplasmic adaptor subunit [Pseudomonadota bacterium]MED5437531.1 efflux RND transporter periplasmic adaptor subunit [Pseudomonadota bacterium]
MRSLIRIIINSRYLPILIILFGFFISFIISSLEPQPNKGIEIPKPTAVFYEIPLKKDVTLKVNTNGEVRSVTEINVIPQVSGRITEVADEFIDGGNIRKDQPLIWIDNRDYKLAVISADSRVAQAKKLLEREIAESELAKKDWEELGEGEASPLTLRIPQLEEARAILNAAKADLEKAKLNLERTIISLPFDGLIKRKNAGIGQYVNAGSILGSAFSTEKVLIPLPLTDTELSYLGLPLGYEAESFFEGPKVVFKSFVSRKNIEWVGRITRISGSIDSQTRLVYAYAEVLNPYDAEPPLAIGTYVDAEIDGNFITDGYLVSISAIKNENKIYIVDQDNKLRIKEIEISGTDGDNVIVKGINDEDMVVVSTLNSGIEGMELTPMLLSKDRDS